MCQKAVINLFLLIPPHVLILDEIFFAMKNHRNRAKLLHLRFFLGMRYEFLGVDFATLCLSQRLGRTFSICVDFEMPFSQV